LNFGDGRMTVGPLSNTPSAEMDIAQADGAKIGAPALIGSASAPIPHLPLRHERSRFRHQPVLPILEWPDNEPCSSRRSVTLTMRGQPAQRATDVMHHAQCPATQ
jgi:hypothetical protein